MVTLILTFFAGALTLLGYVVWRMLRSDGWDDSNVLNALRAISHVAVHPEDLGRMYYLTDVQLMRLKELGEKPARTFWYISEDEFEGVVKTRPPW